MMICEKEMFKIKTKIFFNFNFLMNFCWFDIEYLENIKKCNDEMIKKL